MTTPADRLASAGAGIESRHLVSTYYDTADRRLQRQGLSLRLRPGPGGLIQTLKGGRTASGGLHSVREVEARLGDADADIDAPDLDAIADPDLRETVSLLVGRSLLRPVFETRIDRRSGSLTPGGAEVEVAIDTGEIVANGASLPVCEVEIELRSGPPAATYRAGADLLADIPARLDLAAKADRGYALADTIPPPDARPIRTGTLPQPPASDWTLDQVDTLLGHYARALAGNLHCVFTSMDPEGPHQMRVVLRRLRALLWLAAPALDPDWRTSRLKAFKALGRAVAPARDADVFIDEIVVPTLTAAGETDDDLIARLEAWRTATHEDVRAELRQMQATGEVLALLGSVATRDWHHAGKRGARALLTPFATLAAPALEAGWKAARRDGRKLSKLPAERRHRLRKDLKRLRYGAEMAAGALPDTDGGAGFLTALRRVQTSLGRLNDLDSVAPLRPDLGDPAAEARLAAYLLAATGPQSPSAPPGKSRRRWLDKAAAQWRKLKAADKFWTSRLA